tara:strand:- start:3196 stop:3762 length:567 start_codon:yes stop_codon:yes gene_type:complete
MLVWNEILCLGDSITYGARDEYGRSYPAELGKILTEENKEFYFCHNCGVNAETSSDVLKRAWNTIKSHSNSKIMLLMIGTNDTQAGIPTEVYEDNLRQIISIGRVFGMHIIVGYLPQLGFTPLYLINNHLIDEYNSSILKLSKSLKFDTCDFSGTEKHYVDNVHYTNEGYKEVATIWAKKILSLQKIN